MELLLHQFMFKLLHAMDKIFSKLYHSISHDFPRKYLLLKKERGPCLDPVTSAAGGAAGSAAGCSAILDGVDRETESAERLELELELELGLGCGRRRHHYRSCCRPQQQPHVTD